MLVSEGSTFHTRADTTVDEIIQLFNAKGVYYEEPFESSKDSNGQDVWAERYQTYCKSYALSNWQAKAKVSRP